MMAKASPAPVLPSLLLQRVKLLVSKHSVLSEQSFTIFFFEMFHEELNPSAVDHNSISSLLHTLALLNVVHLTYENCGVTIKPTSTTLKETKTTSEEYDLTELDSIIAFKYEDSNIPPQDCVLSYNLSVEELPRWMKEGATFPVVITQVESPTKFWFNLQQSGHLDKVKRIMEKMDELYKSIKGDMYTIRNTKMLKPGNVLAATYKTEGYHRVMVIKVVDISVVSLFYVDYGTVENQKVKHCRFLHKNFATLPGQAIQARLWGVKPVGGGKGWGSGNKARDKLVELTDTLEGSLVAKIMAGVTRKEVSVKGEDKLEEDRGFALSLLDIFVGDAGSDIATELVVEGVAEWDMWDAQEEVEIGNGSEDTVHKVVKYPGCGGELLDKRMKSKAMSDNESDKLVPSSYLRLLVIQEDNVKRLLKLLDENVKAGKEDRGQKAKSWARMRCLREICEKRKEREKLELINLIDDELLSLPK